MNETQKNWHRMFKNVELNLDDNQEKVKTVAAAEQGRLLIKENITEIDEQYAVQMKSTGGITTDKQKVKEGYVEIILKVSGGVRGFAASTGNNTLLDSVYYTENKLNRISEMQLVDVGKLVYDAAMPIKTEIAAFLVGEPDLELLNTKRNDFNAMIPKKRAATGVSKAATRNLEEVFAETNDFLRNKMDHIMLAFRSVYPDFYMQYQSARMIIDLGHGGEHEKEEPETK
jgi:hypothetical protein